MQTANALLLPQLATTVIEALINQLLKLANTEPAQYQPLLDKVLVLDIKELKQPLSFSFAENQVLVGSQKQTFDAAIASDLATLRSLKTNPNQLTELIKQDKLQLEGELKLVQQVASLAEQIDIDWQTELAKHIGDVASYQLFNIGSKIRDKLVWVKQQISQDSSEYLLHEQKLVVSQIEQANFTQQVQQLEQQVEQLNQRLNNISA